MRPQRPLRADVRAPAPRRRPRAVTCLFPRLCAQAGVGAQPQDLRHRYHLQWLEHLDADAVQIWYCERPLVLSSATPGDALYSLRQSLKDNNNVLQSWDPTLVNPCTWFHVTCNPDNSVIRLDLGNAQLSGPLVPQLGQLKNMQYLELYSNNISGPIPPELGNLTNLVSLDLYLNNFTGGIPDTLGQLSKLRFLRLNNNSLSGQIPKTLTNINTLQVLDLPNNNLSGGVPSSGSFSLFTPISFANNPNLCGPGTTKPCPGAPPFSPPPPYNPPSPASSKGLQIAMLAASW